MSKTRIEKARQVKKKPTLDEFWDLNYFSDFKHWSRYWKPLVNIYLNKEERTLVKKARRYDDLWEAHVALKEDKCPGCEITAKLEAEVKQLASEKDELLNRVKLLEKEAEKKDKSKRKTQKKE